MTKNDQTTESKAPLSPAEESTESILEKVKKGAYLSGNEPANKGWPFEQVLRMPRAFRKISSDVLELQPGDEELD